MNLNWIKNIWHGLNLRGNKIINAVIDPPAISTDIANKEYVDSNNLMNTELAVERETSDRFPDIVNVQTKTVKEVLDDVLFPVIPPLYFNPEIEDYTIILLNSIDNIIYEQNLSKFKFVCTFKTLNDRLPSNPGVIEVKYDDGSKQTFQSDLALNDSDEINFEISNIKFVSGIKYLRSYSPANSKLDNYGNINIPFDFTVNYDYFKNLILFDFIQLPRVGWLLTENDSYIDDILTDISELESDNTSIDDLSEFIQFGNIITSFHHKYILLFLPIQTLGVWKIIFDDLNENELGDNSKVVNLVKFENIDYAVYLIDIGIINLDIFNKISILIK